MHTSDAPLILPSLIAVNAEPIGRHAPHREHQREVALHLWSKLLPIKD